MIQTLQSQIATPEILRKVGSWARRELSPKTVDFILQSRP